MGGAVIGAALRAKLRERGAVGVAADAAKAGVGYAYVAAMATALGTGAFAVAGFLLPLAVYHFVAGDEPHRCGPDCAAHRTSCRNPEEVEHPASVEHQQDGCRNTEEPGS
jgi:hypothetical protein